MCYNTGNKPILGRFDRGKRARSLLQRGRRAEREPFTMDINKYAPKFKIKQEHLLRLADLSTEEIFEILYAAKAMKKKFRVRENSTMLAGKTVALWGLAFKPETDDMREATSLVLIRLLAEAGARVRVYDPIAMGECRRRVGDRVEYARDMYEAAVDADALLLLTEWKQFRLPSWAVLKKAMRRPLILDGRNIYDADELQSLGFTYECIGR